MNADMHFVGCAEWAKAWIARYGRENLDAVTLHNLDAMIARGRASCCRDSS